MNKVLVLVGSLVVGLTSCEKPELNEFDTPEAIGYEVKGWSTSKTSKTSKNDDNTKFDKTTSFEIENSMFAKDLDGRVKEILLTNGEEPNTDGYEVIGSVVYHIDSENFLIVSQNDMKGSFHGRYSTYIIDGIEYHSNF